MYSKKITPIEQFMLLVSTYKKIIIEKKIKCNNYEILFKIKPTDFSRDYLVKFRAKGYEKPRIYIIKPNLLDENSDEQPPHIYSLKEGRICIFLPNEIKSNIKYTCIIPWISEWIIHYEIWKITGKWHGRGHQMSKKI